MFRLALINPNTDARHTEAMGAVARETLPGECEGTAVSPERGEGHRVGPQRLRVVRVELAGEHPPDRTGRRLAGCPCPP